MGVPCRRVVSVAAFGFYSCPLLKAMGGLMFRSGLFLVFVLAWVPSWPASGEPGGPGEPGTRGGVVFAGWQALRTVRLEGNVTSMRVADLDGDGRQELLLVNPRKSRLEIIRWLEKERRRDDVEMDPDDPNILPMAPEFEREELVLDELPREVIAEDLDGDGQRELVILVSPPPKVLVYGRAAAGGWTRRAEYELLSDSIESGSMVLRRRKDDPSEVMIWLSEGIQILQLTEGARPKWMSPRERGRRMDWWLTDLDGDGDKDLVEWRAGQGDDMWWHLNVDGQLLPAELIGDQAVLKAGVLDRPGRADELLLLRANQPGVLNRYVLDRGEENAAGERRTLPLPEGAKRIWCGMEVGGRPAMVFPDPGQPRLYVHELGDSGWQPARSYPIVSNVRALAALQGGFPALLIWAKDASDLHISRWENDRLTYPRPMPPPESDGERSILALESVGKTVWWVQKVGEALDLFVWDDIAEEPARTRFEGVGRKADRVKWLGGAKLLVLEQYGRIPKLAAIEEGEVVVSQPKRLKKMGLDDIRLLAVDGGLRPARLADGVLQWLGDDMHPVDQIMLPDAKRLAHYVPLGGGRAWALEQGGDRMHLLAPDESGIPQVAETVKLPGGTALRDDPVLGLILEADDRLVKLGRGRPWELKLIESFDNRLGRPTGIKEAAVHRLFTTDVNGDGHHEVVLCDDQRHQITVLGLDEEQKLKPLISWSVFEDKTYPYAASFREQAEGAEPRSVQGADVDGDRIQDLAMLCHDRLLIYLARE